MFCLLSFFSAFPRFVYCPWMLVFDCPFNFSGHLQYTCSCTCILVKVIFIAQHTFHFKPFPICSVCVSLVILCQFISLYVNKYVLNVTTSLFNSNLKIVNFLISQVFTTPAPKIQHDINENFLLEGCWVCSFQGRIYCFLNHLLQWEGGGQYHLSLLFSTALSWLWTFYLSKQKHGLWLCQFFFTQ